MSLFKPKYFAKTYEQFAKEVLPPSVYEKYGVNGLRMMDQRILEFLDEFRHNVGLPLSVNTPWNGVFTQSGLRDVGFEGYSDYEDLYFSLSDHTRGSAVDVKCSKGGHFLRSKFIEEEDYYYKEYGVCFVETGPLSSGKNMSWAHFSIRTDFYGEVKYWSPKLGFVSKEKVIKDKL